MPAPRPTPPGPLAVAPPIVSLPVIVQPATFNVPTTFEIPPPKAQSVVERMRVDPPDPPMASLAATMLLERVRIVVGSPPVQIAPPCAWPKVLTPSAIGPATALLPVNK